MNKFNVGDKVFNLVYGWGIVERVGQGEHKPVAVVYTEKGSSPIWYYQDGRQSSVDSFPTLFTAREAKIKFPEYLKPKEKQVIKDHFRKEG